MVEGSPQRDARDLRRGLWVNALGYAAKLGMPVLLALATRLYGAERWGVFVAGQAIVLLLARVCLLGLDKGLLWWAARREPELVSATLRSAMRIVTLSAGAVSGVLLGCAALVGLPWVPAQQQAALAVVVVGLVPFVWSELLLHATMAQRRMDVQVAVRDTLNPLVQLIVALLAFEVGGGETGLAWGFVVSQGVGALVAFAFVRRSFGRVREAARPFGLPPELLRYAWPLWLADLSNSLLLRLDVVVLTACVDAKSLGVWGVVMQFANSLRQIRRAFDPLVTAICADIAGRRDKSRLAEAYSRATELVSLTQLPVFAVLLVACPFVLPLYGAGFEAGTVPLILLCAFILLNGASGLAGLVINGYGRSGLTLMNTLLALLLEYGLLLGLAPRYGLSGAALAIGLTLTATNALQLVQMRMITGGFNYTARAKRPLWIGLGATLAGLATWGLGAGLSVVLARASALVVFLVVYGGLIVLLGRAQAEREKAQSGSGAAQELSAS